MTEIKKYSQQDQQAAVDLLLLAFSSDPLQRFLMPDPSIYFKIQQYGLTMQQVNQYLHNVTRTSR